MPVREEDGAKIMFLHFNEIQLNCGQLMHMKYALVEQHTALLLQEEVFLEHVWTPLEIF